MNLQKLKAVLDADAYGLDWANDLDDANVANEINTTLVAAVKDVDNKFVQLWAAGAVYDKIDTGSQITLPDPQEDAQAYANAMNLRGLCKAALVWYGNQNDYKRGIHLPLLQALLAGGVLTSGEVSALDDLADTTETIAHKEKLGTVLAGHVTQVRAI